MRLLGFLVALLVATGSVAARPVVLVTIPPHASLVERLAGDAVDVRVVLAPGESPAMFDPTPRQLQELVVADLWLTTGAPLEATLMPKLGGLAPAMRIVRTHAGLELLAGACQHHDHDHEHDHGDVDPHVWLSPQLTSAQVVVMADALMELLPDRAAAIDAAGVALVQDLAQIHRELEAMLAPVRGQTVFVYHPAFGYFCHEFGLEQEAIERGGLAPSPRHLTELLTSIAAQGARTIFIQPQYSDRAVRSVAEQADLAVVVLDPLARDHLANLRHIGEAIARGLEVTP
jgi:zinc transport system substrate-binding protein